MISNQRIFHSKTPNPMIRVGTHRDVRSRFFRHRGMCVCVCVALVDFSVAAAPSAERHQRQRQRQRRRWPRRGHHAATTVDGIDRTRCVRVFLLVMFACFRAGRVRSMRCALGALRALRAPQHARLTIGPVIYAARTRTAKQLYFDAHTDTTGRMAKNARANMRKRIIYVRTRRKETAGDFGPAQSSPLRAGVQCFCVHACVMRACARCAKRSIRMHARRLVKAE